MIVSTGDGIYEYNLKTHLLNEILFTFDLRIYGIASISRVLPTAVYMPYYANIDYYNCLLAFGSLIFIFYLYEDPSLL